MSRVYDDHGIRFEYPEAWEADVSDDDGRTTVTVQSPGGLAFAMVTLDEDGPDPAEMVEEAMVAMREEYPGLEAAAAVEEIAGYEAEGQDLEFFSLDMTNACTIRAFRTPRRTVLVFGQWSEADDEDEAPERIIAAIRRSLEETDS